MFSLSLSVFKSHNALADRKVFLSSILLNNEKASSLFELGMRSNLECFEVFHLLFMSGVELNNVLHESLVISSQLFSIFLQI